MLRCVFNFLFFNANTVNDGPDGNAAAAASDRNTMIRPNKRPPPILAPFSASAIYFELVEVLKL